MGIFKQKESAAVQEMKKLEQMAQEDQKTIETYSQMPQEKISYQYNSKKSAVRNYRDLMIYRTMRVEEAESYGKFQKAADYVMANKNRLGEIKMAGAEDAFSVDQVVLHLCSSSLLQDSVTAEDFRTLTDHLMAGSYLQGGNPNIEICRTLQKEGIKALQEIYFRQLEGLSRKYGDKTMMKLSPAAYLKAYPQIEQDFACLEDMKQFFGIYGSQMEQTSELQRMMQLLTYYSLSWKAVKARQDVFENGDLDGKAEADFREQMDVVYQAAKEQKLFEKRKPRTKMELATFFQTRKNMQAASMTAKKIYQNIMKSEEAAGIAAEEKAAPYKAKYQGYQQYKEDRAALAKLLDKQELNEEETKQKEFYEKVIDEYEKSSNFLTDEAAAVLFREYNKILDDANPYRMETLTNDNALEFCRDIVNRIEQLCNTLRTCSDQELIKRYTELITEKKYLDGKIKYVTYSHDFFANASKAAQKAGVDLLHSTAESMEKFKNSDPYHYELRRMHTLFSNLKSDNPLYQNAEQLLEARLTMIEKYGFSNSSTLTEERDVAAGLFGVKEKYEETVKAQAEAKRTNGANRILGPVSFADALKLNFNGNINRFQDLENLDLDVICREIAACKKVKEIREAQPNFYHLGLKFSEHAKAEAICELLPYYERALELTLQYLGVKGHDSASFASLKAGWEAAVALYDKKQFEAYKADTAKYKYENRYEAQRQKKNALYQENDLWPEQAEEQIKSLVIEDGVEFITDFSKEMKKKDIEFLYTTATYIDQVQWEKNYAVSDEQFDAIAVVTSQFVSAYTQLEEKLRKTDYTDYKFFELRNELLKCEKQTYFLENLFKDEKAKEALMDRCGNQEALELLKEWFQTMPERIQIMRALAEQAVALEIEYASVNGVKEMMVWVDGSPVEISGKWMKNTAAEKKKYSQPVILKLRKENHQEEIRKQQMEARVRHALGREKIASDAKTFAANLKQVNSWESLGGNLIGTPLQVFSWVMHEKRTADHGIVRYEECVTKHKTMHRILGQGNEMQEACLPAWQRGSDEYAPVLNLDALFSSPMKKRIYTAVHSVKAEPLLQYIITDMMDEEFRLAMDAISRYVTVVGIVNTDTTEMEMAFLDMFQKKAQEYLESSIASEDELVVQRCALLKEILEDLMENLNGTMADTISKEELDKINKGTVAYVENTIFSQNMDESNIQDIPLFLHEPNINDVRQSSIGDCWLVSAITALVKASPDFVRSMFHDTGDGNVIVRLFGTERNGERITSDKGVLYDKTVKVFPIYVKLRKHYETGWGNASDCIWVQLLEKAYALSGLNMRNEMRVEGNQMYNVTDELTYGQHDLALLHMTGQHPETIPKEPFILREEDFYGVEFLAAMLDGFSERVVNRIGDFLFSQGGASESYHENTTKYLADVLIAMAGGEMTEDAIRQKLDQNIQNMKSGIRSADFDTTMEIIAEKRKEYQKVIGENRAIETKELEYMAMSHYAEYFEQERNPNYTPNENLFYQRCKKAFASGSALSVAIPHCVDLLDAQEKNGKYFILLRDPFNIYNNEYTVKEDGTVEKKEERFTKVLTANKGNRYIRGNGEDIIRHAFRGTSWFELKDLYKIVYGIYKAPVDLKVNQF